MAQHDYIISNQTFPNTRADINNLASAIATNNSGTSAPTTQYAGQFWIDTTSSTWTLYIHDGSDDIQFATIDTSANTVNFTDSALSVQTDPNPTLGANLDLNSNDITGTGNINITGTATVTGLTTTGDINFGDNDKAVFGAGSDLEIYHNGSNSFISDVGTGLLAITSTNQVRIQKEPFEPMATFNVDGSVELYHDNSKKLETTSGGATVTGTLTATAFSGDGSALTGISGGGITEADQWRLNTSFSGNAVPIASNLERVDNASFGYIGTGMSESSGIFTFPSTGIYKIDFFFQGYRNAADDQQIFGEIQVTTNNSTYTGVAYALFGSNYANQRLTVGTSYFFDVTNTSTHKVKFDISSNAGNNLIFGSTDINSTFMNFIRLGDT